MSKGKILLMDDEDTVRKVVKRMLTAGGYKVELAEDGEEAIDLFKTAKELGRPFDAVILDLIVPRGMGGKRVMEELLQIDPEVKAIVASGYSEDPVMEHFKDHGFRGIISKPFTFDQVKNAVHNVLSMDN